MKLYKAVMRDGWATPPTLWRHDWDLPHVAASIARIEVVRRSSEWYVWTGGSWKLGPGALSPIPRRRRDDRQTMLRCCSSR